MTFPENLGETDQQRLRQLHADLGIRADHLAQRNLIWYPQADNVIHSGTTSEGRELFLTPETAAQWAKMRDQAAGDGCTLLPVSGFRSHDYQAGLIRAKLDAGINLSEALAVVAPPGASEHHTGRALDIGCPDSEFLEESFADTPEFRWLERHASAFGFHMSFPRNNPQGFIYEPWHWCLQEDRP